MGDSAEEAKARVRPEERIWMHIHLWVLLKTNDLYWISVAHDDDDDDDDADDEYPVTGSLDEIPMLAQVILTPLTSSHQICLLKTK